MRCNGMGSTGKPAPSSPALCIYSFGCLGGTHEEAVILAATLLALVTVSPAHAMPNQDAKQLAIAAYQGNPSDLAHLETSAIHGDIQAQFWLGAYYGSEGDRAKVIHWY